MMVKRLMMFKLASKRRGISEVISTILVVMITVAAMVLTTSYSQTIIESQSAQMGERLTIEEVLFDGTYIRIYARNIGQTNIILEQVKINGILVDLPNKIVLAPREANPNSEAKEVKIEGGSVEGLYVISFVSSLNKDLGSVEAHYLLQPRISIIEPTVGQKINTLTPEISAIVSDPSRTVDIIPPVGTIVMKLDQRTLSCVVSELNDFDISVFYKVLPSESLDETVIYHTVSMEVIDGMNNVAKKIWWFEVDVIPPSIVLNVGVAKVDSTTLTVSWKLNPEPDISHYSVYRGTLSSGPYQWVADRTSTTNSYTDEKLSPGTYYYVVTAVDEAGNESVKSSEMFGTLP
jgi:flagellin-like protein